MIDRNLYVNSEFLESLFAFLDEGYQYDYDLRSVVWHDTVNYGRGYLYSLGNNGEVLSKCAWNCPYVPNTVSEILNKDVELGLSPRGYGTLLKERKND